MSAISRILLIALALSLIAGCGGKPVPPERSSLDEPADRLTADVAPPGLYELPGGRTQVIGTLVYNGELEGGFWAIAPRTPSMGSDAQPVVIANADLFGRPVLESLEGSYVVAEGTLSDGVSIRMAGPELVADNLNRIEAPRTENGERILRGVPPRWARVEKPGVHELPNGSVRVVGMLASARSGDSMGTPSWVVLNEMPFGTGGAAETNVVLTEGPFGSPEESKWASRYVAVTGDVIGAMRSGDTTVPVVRVVDVEVVTTQEPTVDEVFD